MPEPQTQDEILGISTAVEVSYNTYALLANLYTYFYCRSAQLPAPDREKFDNTGFIGLQQEGATIQRSGFVTPPSASISGDVDTGIFAVFARRTLGKADVVPAGADIIVAAESFRHKFALLGNQTAAGRQLPSSAFAFSNGALDYIFAGMVGSQLTIQQNGAETPQYTSDWVGSGMYREISTISGPAFGVPTPPTDNTASIMDGAETEVEYTTGAGTKFLAQINAAATQALRSISTTVVANNLDTGDRRAGAKRLDSTTPQKGWILSFLLHGNRTSTGEMRVGVGAAGATVDELQAALNDTTVTNFHFRMHGDPFATFGVTPASRHTVEVIFDKCYFRNVRRAPDNGAEFIDVGIFPVSSGLSTDPDFVRMQVVNATATAIV